MPESAFNAQAPNVVAGEPMTVRIGQNDYKMGRITLRDFAALAQKLHDERIAALMRFHDRMTGTEFAIAAARCASILPTEQEVHEYAMTERGMCFLVWRALVRYQPQLTDQEVECMVSDNLELTGILFGASGWQQSEPDAASEAEPKKAAVPSMFTQPTGQGK